MAFNPAFLSAINILDELIILGVEKYVLYSVVGRREFMVLRQS
jgi:hypothetical protein